MRTCACGAGNPDSAKFCAECGRSLDAAAPVACAACGAENVAGARFCTRCGAGLAPGAVRPPAAPAAAFDPKMLVGPITSLQGARTMAWIGAAGAAMLFLHALIWGAPVLQTGQPFWILIYLARLAIYGGSAYALYRGWTVGGLVSLVLHAYGLLTGLMTYNAALRLTELDATPPTPTAGAMVWIFIRWILIPVALVCGIRGSMAWNRFRRGEGGPA